MISQRQIPSAGDIVRRILSRVSPGAAPSAPQTPPTPLIDSQKKVPSAWEIVRRILSRVAPLTARFTVQIPAIANGLMPDIEPQTFFSRCPFLSESVRVQSVPSSTPGGAGGRGPACHSDLRLRPTRRVDRGRTGHSRQGRSRSPAEAKIWTRLRPDPENRRRFLGPIKRKDVVVVGWIETPRWFVEMPRWFVETPRRGVSTYLAYRAAVSTASNSSWRAPLLAAMLLVPRDQGWPRMSVTVPPASSTKSQPAAQSQGWRCISQ